MAIRTRQQIRAALEISDGRSVFFPEDAPSVDPRFHSCIPHLRAEVVDSCVNARSALDPHLRLLPQA